jgi:NAD(P)-dependent dehydrogenase (short-subunit alcohol dehydrogenase family)
MNFQDPYQLFNLEGKTAVITGGGGILCSEMSRALALVGVSTAILDINIQTAQEVAAQILDMGGCAIAVECNVLEIKSLQQAKDTILKSFHQIDILICGAGGNKPQATTSQELPFFDLPIDALRWVFELNFIGTLLTSQIFGEVMANQGFGNILNISSMNAFRPLTRIPAYSAAKAAVSNFTQWLAVHMAKEYSDKIRVNALAPGFFVGEQNRHFLLNEDNTLTARGRTIIEHTPLGRFGTPDELIGTMLFLLSPASRFVTGIVVPVDGGFSAFSGI